MGFLLNKLRGDHKGKTGKTGEEKEATGEPFTFADDYTYPNLYEEADEMLQVALLIYPITDLRTLAKKKGKELKTPEKILDLPLTLETALGMINDNIEVIKNEVGENDHEMTMSALQSMQERYDRHSAASSKWLKDDGNVKPAFITAYGDENPDKNLVYAVGVDPMRKRVTVAFRGSVTPSDFLTDACISFHKRDNPLKDLNGQQESHIGIHSGFDEYLLKRRKIIGETKFDEIMEHVKKLFEEQDRRENYKLCKFTNVCFCIVAFVFQSLSN